MISRSLRLYWLLGLFLFSAALLIIGIQWVQASDTVPASDDDEGYCTTTASAVSGSGSIAVIRSGSNCILTFKASTNTTTAVFNWTPPSWLAQASQAEYLVAAGGASGNRGVCGIYWGQGGGGGGVATGFANFDQGISVYVGAGGAAGNTSCDVAHTGNPGESSSLGSILAIGGRTGTNNSTDQSGKFGGESGFPTLISLTTGNSGGEGRANHINCDTDCEVGGGGGAGGAGSGVNGGPGITSAISGVSVVYGSGGGGRGSSNFGTATSGGGVVATPNATQHQGGGGSDFGTGWGAGGSGIVIVKYPIPPNPVFNTGTAIALVDPRAESVQIPAVDLTSYVGNRSCITLDKPGESLDLDGSTNSKYKVEVIGSSGVVSSDFEVSNKHLGVSGDASQMSAAFNSGSSKSLIKISRPTNSNFNEELTLTIKTDNRPGADCSTDSPSSTALVVTIKPYGLGVNQKNTITLS